MTRIGSWAGPICASRLAGPASRLVMDEGVAGKRRRVTSRRGGELQQRGCLWHSPRFGWMHTGDAPRACPHSPARPSCFFRPAPRFERSSIMDLAGLLISLISGAVGGNVAGAAMQDKSLGVVGNSIAGIVGGGLGSTIHDEATQPTRPGQGARQPRGRRPRGLVRVLGPLPWEKRQVRACDGREATPCEIPWQRRAEKNGDMRDRHAAHPSREGARAAVARARRPVWLARALAVRMSAIASEPPRSWSPASPRSSPWRERRSGCSPGRMERLPSP